MVVVKSKHIHAKGILTLAIDRSCVNRKVIYSCSCNDTFVEWTCSDTGELFENIKNTANKCQGALAVYGEDVYLAETSQDVITGIDKQIVSKYGLTAFLPTNVATFTMEVTALDCNGTYLVAGSNDFFVKFIKLESEMDEDVNSGHRFECDGVVLSILISPDGEYAAISSSDGCVQIRQTSRSSKKPLAKFKVGNPFSSITIENPRIQCAWHPNGKLLYLPSTGCIIPINCVTWEKGSLIIPVEIASETFSVITLSRPKEDNLFIAASTIEGSIVVWNYIRSQYQLVNIHKKIQKGIGTITSIIFNPSNDNILLIAYSEGYICSMTNIKQSNANFGQNNVFIDDAAMESSSRSASVEGIIQLDANDNEDDIETDIGLIKSQFGFPRSGEQHIGKTTGIPKNYILPQSTEPSTTVKGMCVPKQFSVGSTPSAQEGRYLIWNSYGIIKSYNNEDETTIEINFHDSTIHHEIIMDNTTTNYSLGDINSTLIALASRKNSNKESELYVHNVTSWDYDSRKWTQTMNAGEVIEALALGREFIAIYTNLRYLRIFTPTGTQRFVTSLAGHLVTLCARENKLATAYSLGGVIVETEDDYDHQVFVSQYLVDSLSGECSPALEWAVPLALSPYSKLNWLQFSACGNLVAMDDECTVRIYIHPKGTWIPIVIGAELIKDPDADYIWPIAVSELPNTQFRYIYCRNAKYPPVNKSAPPPTTTAFGLPAVNSASERGKLEAELMAIEIQQNIAQKREFLRPDQVKEMAQLTQNYVADLLKLFSISCQTNRESRAAEMAHRATNPKIVQGLCNYAAKVQRPNLSEKVASIGRERLRAIENEQKRQSEFKQRPLLAATSSIQMAASSSNQSNPVEPIMVPAKILMSKRKMSTQIASMMSNLNSIGKNPPEKEIENPSTVRNREEPKEKENADDFMMDDDDVSSIGGESELDISISSSVFLSNSALLDSPRTSNPFKKAKQTPSAPPNSLSIANRRGFSEKQKDDRDEGSIPDFFDSLVSSNGRKK